MWMSSGLLEPGSSTSPATGIREQRSWRGRGNMGHYIPKKNVKRSVSDTLTEAEEDHFLDCPNADFFVRTAAFLLDGIFLFLSGFGLHRLFEAASLVLVPTESFQIFLGAFSFALEASLLYFYLWSLHHWGASPAKLLFGLRVLNSLSGRRLRFSEVCFREFLGKGLSLVSLAGFFLPLFRQDRLALHDLISHSIVKRVHGGL